MTTTHELKWPHHPTDSTPVSLVELGKMKCVYLADRRAYRDPTIGWGTAVDARPMTEFIASESRRANLLLSPAHVLVCAVARAISENPKFNRKVIGRRVYPYNEVNIVTPVLTAHNGQVEPMFLRAVERMSLCDVAQQMWTAARTLALAAAEEARRDQNRSPWNRFWVESARALRLWGILSTVGLVFALDNQVRRRSRAINARFNGVSALVNILSFPGGAPPMLGFKPSALPINAASLSVTMGAPEWRPAVVDGQVVAQRMVPLFVRADHRLVHSHEIAAFLNTLCAYLTQPQRLVEPEPLTHVVRANEYKAAAA